MHHSYLDLQKQKQRVCEHERQGELFKAYDIAHEALKTFENEVWFQHRAVLCLANAGAIELAREKFQAFGLDLRQDIECITLNGRLFKQMALQTAYAERTPLLKQAIACYELAWQDALSKGSNEAYYPGINVATLNLLAGENQTAKHIAQQVLTQLQPLLSLPSSPSADSNAASLAYWPLATAIEARLILGHIDEAKNLASQAVAVGKDNFVQLASTAKQLGHVLRHLGLTLSTLNVFIPPEVLHYTGHMISKPGATNRLPADEVPCISELIHAEIAASNIVAAFGSLAAGSDILFAEALLAKGVKLHVMLPFNKEEFLAISVRPFGEEWEARFENCLKQAQDVYFVTEDDYLGDDSLFMYCSQLAMGFAVLSARHLFGKVRQIAVWDGQSSRSVAGTAQDIAIWRREAHAQKIIRCGTGPEEEIKAITPSPYISTGRSCRAMLFGDFQSFSKLKDAAIPTFSSLVMGKVAKVFEQCNEQRDFLNTWGDGIFAVYKDVGMAAEAALQLQEILKNLNLAAAGLPEDLLLRLGGHIGPVYEVHDPVLKRRNFMGAHVTRAARVEPVTLAGCVFITESFAALIALHNANQYRCDYVGMRALAKNYSTVPVFSLRRVFPIENGPVQPTAFSLSGMITQANETSN